MAINIKRPNGTEDVLPKDVYKWHTVEKIARETAESFGFSEIRIPTFENTDLFLRSVGETTDVVQKEMYTVKAKETEFTLRPEGTAGTIRAMLQNGLLNEALPQKVFYMLSCFRHERPQAGRLREFHQFGIEMAGSAEPSADAEVILLAKAVDGVYDSDPRVHPDAKKYDEVSIDEVIEKNLQVVDMTASIMARDNKKEMWVFDLNEENSIVNTIKGKFNGTKVTV